MHIERYVPLVFLIACVAEDESSPRRGVLVGEGDVPRSGAWDEALAHDVDPCGSIDLTACGASTGGACGVVALADGEACLPRFNWGVTSDGAVEFASSERLFRIADLELAPLSTVEHAEADALVAELEAFEPSRLLKNST